MGEEKKRLFVINGSYCLQYTEMSHLILQSSPLRLLRLPRRYIYISIYIHVCLESQFSSIVINLYSIYFSYFPQSCPLIPYKSSLLILAFPSLLSIYLFYLYSLNNLKISNTPKTRLQYCTITLLSNPRFHQIIFFFFFLSFFSGEIKVEFSLISSENISKLDSFWKLFFF